MIEEQVTSGFFYGLFVIFHLYLAIWGPEGRSRGLPLPSRAAAGFSNSTHSYFRTSLRSHSGVSPTSTLNP